MRFTGEFNRIIWKLTSCYTELLPMEEILLSTIDEHAVLPSFLELYSLHQLNSAPLSVIRHITTSCLPPCLQDSSDSIRNALEIAELLVQAQVLINTGASMGEHLYGLVQVTKTKDGVFKPLNSSEKKLCVLSMLLPFVLSTLKGISISSEDLDCDDYDKDGHVGRFTSLLHNIRKLKSFVSRTIKKHNLSIALLCTAHKMSVGIQQLAYLFSLSSSFYPVHQYLGIQQIRKKFVSYSGASDSSSNTNHAVTALFVTALCFKVAEMLNRLDTDVPPSESGQDEDLSMYPSPPAVLPHFCTLPSDPLLCPLCKQTKKEPSSSRGGYIFCYSCLSTSLSRHPYCPITGIGCTVQDIIKLCD